VPFFDDDAPPPEADPEMPETARLAELVDQARLAAEPGSRFLDCHSIRSQCRFDDVRFATTARHGAADVAVVLQEVLRTPAAPGGPFVLEGAGFQVKVKTPRYAERTRPTRDGQRISHVNLN
jgi:hypothetical protein